MKRDRRGNECKKGERQKAEESNKHEVCVCEEKDEGKETGSHERYILTTVGVVKTEYVAIERSSHLINWGLPPTSNEITKGATLRERSHDYHVRICMGHMTVTCENPQRSHDFHL